MKVLFFEISNLKEIACACEHFHKVINKSKNRDRKVLIEYFVGCGSGTAVCG